MIKKLGKVNDQVKHVFWCLGLLLVPTFTPALAQTDFLVEKVVLAKDVDNKNPMGIHTPPAYCEKDKNGQAAIPVVRISQTAQIVFWIKVKATTTGKLRHSWHHQIAGSWKKISEINIPVRPSSGYRMWSTKLLHPDLHIGEWMIVVAPSNEPDRILCIARFTVK
jgi:hypothetical protein